MPAPKPARVSLSEVAKAAGVSVVAASYALRNRPGVSRATREKIQRIAKRLGYKPDARIASWMTRMQGARSKDLLPIAWLNTHLDKDAWQKYKFYSPYLEGACERASEMGYRIEQIWTAERGMTMRRLSQILYKRGIEGAIVTQSAAHLRLKWDSLAAVSLEGYLLAPRHHKVLTDRAFNLLLALKMLRRTGYRRIGICLDSHFVNYPHQGCLMAVDHYMVTIRKADRIKPLFYPWNIGVDLPQIEAGKAVTAWLRRYQPEVIVGHNNHLVLWAEQAGYRVPHDIGVVHLATDDDVSDWAGVCSSRKEIGATAAEWVISLLQNRRFGVPKIALSTLVQGSWHLGRTLIVPKPGSAVTSRKLRSSKQASKDHRIT